MADQRKTNSDDSWFPWALIIFLFVVKAWPIALVMLLIKLFADDEKKERTAAPPPQKPVQQRNQPMAGGQAAAQPRQPMKKQAAPEKGPHGHEEGRQVPLGEEVQRVAAENRRRGADILRRHGHGHRDRGYALSL